MKRKWLSCLLASVLAMLLLTACGGVPKEKLDEVRTGYARVEDLYTELSSMMESGGLLEDEEYAEEFAEWGEEIESLGSAIEGELKQADQEEIEQLISSLNQISSQLEHARDTIKQIVEP